MRKCVQRRQAVPQAQPSIVQPDAPLPFIEEQTALKQIHTRNLQDNINLMRWTAPERPNQHDTIPMVIEDQHLVNMDRHLPRLCPLTSTFNKDVQLKTCRDVPNQKVTDKIIDHLNYKTMHLPFENNLPFALDTLKKGIISYLEDNHLLTNIKLQQSIITEAENILLFNGLLFHFTVKSSKTVEHKLALCILIELSDSIFELYHSGLLTSHQGLTRTYSKIRQDFFIRNLYKYLYLYIMSCRICSASRDIPFNQKQWSWSSKVIHDVNIMEFIGMHLKVMHTSFHGYNYLLVMRCNHSHFIITDTLKSRKASEVAESIFQKLICAHGTNIKEINCDLDTALKNEIVSMLLNTLGITVQFCSVQSHHSNPAERAIQSVSNILINYIAKNRNLWCIKTNMATFCLNILPISHLKNLSSYNIVYGRKLLAVSDLQLEGDALTRPPFYPFTDYLDLLNEWIHALHDIVKEHHNQTIEKRLQKHRTESLSLRLFNEGDIVYCHFPSKTIISHHNLPSKKLKMSCVGPL